MKTFNQYNESLRDKMTPKTEEEIYKNLSDEEQGYFDKLKEFEIYIQDKWDAETKYNRKTDREAIVFDGEAKIYRPLTFNIKTDLFWAHVSFIEDEYNLYFESFVGTTMISDLIFKTKEEVFKWIEIEVDTEVKERIYVIKEKIVELESDQAELEINYKKFKKS